MYACMYVAVYLPSVVYACYTFCPSCLRVPLL